MSYEKNFEGLFVTFISSAVEGLLCGIFLVLASVGLYLILVRPGGSARELNPPRRTSTFPRPLVVGSVILLVFIVAHWACTMARTAKNISLVAAGLPSTEIEARLSGFRLANLGMLACVGIVTDGLLMWRLWIVSSQSRIAVAPPVISWLAFSAFSVRMCLLLSKYSLRDERMKPWVVAIGTSVTLRKPSIIPTSTGALTYYISRIQSRTMCSDKSKFANLLTLVIESAGLWAVWSGFVLICFITGSSLLEFTYRGCPAIGGIACILINVRVGLGRDVSPSQASTISIRGPIRFLREEDVSVEAGVNVEWEKVEAVPGEMAGSGDGKLPVVIGSSVSRVL
ncbi:hypothetical protein FA15DRAFT_724084 [Coprinopsis marcescibilis]|uniref:Uncharacterized protein n=1 Tax=Coprinopsis marcescibilis TaxID=230819 RepID=A0A5C3L5U7_COPMA|nr:hypothetical protein FA15DRAFT_724084 [Coprinopsis marcescibilis]